MRKTPEVDQVRRDIDRGRHAVTFAEATRMRLRRRSNPGGEREDDIAEAFRLCRSAARPIRRYIGMLNWHSELEDFDAPLRELSQELTAERRRLTAMKRR